MAQALSTKCACHVRRYTSKRDGRPFRSHRASFVCMAGTMEDQAKEFANAERRWEESIRQGRIKPVTSSDFKKLREDGWTVLDVRPPEEVKKAEVKDTVNVPLFIVDDDSSFGGVLKQMSAFGMGGWWLGGQHMKPNDQFISEVQAKIPKDSGVIVCCQKGLRSLSACEQLANAGYEKINWLTGGFDACEKEDVETTTGIDVRYAGIGGLSELLGWTEVQQRERKGFMGGFENILRIFAIILVLDTVLFAVEAIVASVRSDGLNSSPPDVPKTVLPGLENLPKEVLMNAARRTSRPLKPFVALLIILLIILFASVDNLRQNSHFRGRDVSLAKFLGKEKLDRPTRAYCKTGGTLICAHGGDFSHHLPNTVEAFQSAIARGVRCIEADVTLTSDGQLLVVHKREILAMTKTGNKPPYNLTSQIIFDVASRENVHIPTLEEILEQFLSQVDLMILDVKINHLPGAADNEGQTIRVLTAILRKYQRKNCLVWSESKNVIFAVKKELPQILTGYIIKSRWHTVQPNNFDGQARQAANVIAYHHSLINRKIINKAKNEGKQIIAWTANGDEFIQRLLDLGIHGIVTDFPVQALTAVHKRNRWCKTSFFLQGRLLL